MLKEVVSASVARSEYVQEKTESDWEKAKQDLVKLMPLVFLASSLVAIAYVYRRR